MNKPVEIPEDLKEPVARQKLLSVLELVDEVQERLEEYDKARSAFTQDIIESKLTPEEFQERADKVDDIRTNLYASTWLLASYNKRRERDHENLA